jgi:hypothetical protein
VRTCPISPALAIKVGRQINSLKVQGTWIEYLDHNDLRSEELESFGEIYLNVLMILCSTASVK